MSFAILVLGRISFVFSFQKKKNSEPKGEDIFFAVVEARLAKILDLSRAQIGIVSALAHPVTPLQPLHCSYSSLLLHLSTSATASPASYMRRWMSTGRPRKLTDEDSKANEMQSNLQPTRQRRQKQRSGGNIPKGSEPFQFIEWTPLQTGRNARKESLQFVQWTPPVSRTPVPATPDVGMNLKVPETGDFVPDRCSIPKQTVVASKDERLRDQPGHGVSRSMSEPQPLPERIPGFSMANQDSIPSIVGRGKEENSIYSVHAVSNVDSEKGFMGAVVAKHTSSSNGRSNLERGYMETIESQSEANEAEALDDDALAEQLTLSTNYRFDNSTANIAILSIQKWSGVQKIANAFP